MQTQREKLGYAMMLLPPLESIIPADHRLRKLHRVLDLSFVHAAVRDRYCQDNGRPSVDPEVAVRLFLLQAIAGIRTARIQRRGLGSFRERTPRRNTNSRPWSTMRRG